MEFSDVQRRVIPEQQVVMQRIVRVYIAVAIVNQQDRVVGANLGKILDQSVGEDALLGRANNITQAVGARFLSVLKALSVDAQNRFKHRVALLRLGEIHHVVAAISTLTVGVISAGLYAPVR